MCLNKAKKTGKWETALIWLFPAFLEKCFLYLLIFAVPLLYYPLKVDGGIIDLRKIREIGFYSFAIIICSFLQRSRWLRYFVIWCVINWWVNFFLPRESYIGLTNVFSALVLYIGLKFLLEKGFLKVDVILRIVCVAVLFQFGWLITQMFNYDPLEWWKWGPGFYAITASGQPLGTKVPLVSWSGNPCVLGIFFASTSFLLLHYFKIRKLPILFFVILSSAFIIKNATTAICFASGGLFYLLNRYRFKMKYILVCLLVVVMLGTFFVYIKAPNFDRFPIWQKLLQDGIKVKPFTGKGINFFAHLFIIDKTGTPWKEAHNDYLQMILELGIIGFVLFSGWIVSRFVVFFRQAKNNKQICIATCLVAFLIAGVSMFPMHLAQISFYAVLLLAVLESIYVNSKSFSPHNI